MIVFALARKVDQLEVRAEDSVGLRLDAARLLARHDALRPLRRRWDSREQRQLERVGDLDRRPHPRVRRVANEGERDTGENSQQQPDHARSQRPRLNLLSLFRGPDELRGRRLESAQRPQLSELLRQAGVERRLRSSTQPRTDQLRLHLLLRLDDRGCVQLAPKDRETPGVLRRESDGESTVAVRHAELQDVLVGLRPYARVVQELLRRAVGDVEARQRPPGKLRHARERLLRLGEAIGRLRGDRLRQSDEACRGLVVEQHVRGSPVAVRLHQLVAEE